MSYFFNSDFEDYLASDCETYQIQSNKKNQELEYFILWLEDEALYSEKKYAPQYIKFLSEIKQSEVKITSDINGIKLWCQSVENKKQQRILNSKRTSVKFAIENDLAHPETKILSRPEPIKDSYIYKDPLGVSGIGCWKGSLHKEKIISFLKEKKMIAEPLLDRSFDIGCCVFNDKDYIYQNHVDKHFQYKGSTLGLKFDNLPWFEDYKNKILKIKNHYNKLGIEAPYSIDSFLYKKDNEEKLYALSEVNARKTMGYVAIRLWEKYLSKYRYSTFKLIRSKDIKNKIDHQRIYDLFHGHIIPLSPYGNIFFTYIIGADSIHDLYEFEDDLLTTLFNNI